MINSSQTMFERIGLGAKRAILVAASGILLALAANVPSADAGTYNGNQCHGAAWYIDNGGADACLHKSNGSRYSVTLTPGAADLARDGYSALNRTYVLQWVPGSGWVRSNFPYVLNSAGYGTTRLLEPQLVSRIPGATHVRFVINACTYDVPTRRYISCAAKRWTLPWPA